MTPKQELPELRTIASSIAPHKTIALEVEDPPDHLLLERVMSTSKGFFMGGTYCYLIQMGSTFLG